MTAQQEAERKRAHNSIDHSGKVINGWSIINYVDTVKKRRPRYLCRCVCGKEKISTILSILQGTSKSCGCQNVLNHIKHGGCGTRTYNIWKNIKARCFNKKSTQYKWYGGRGITMCQEWVNDFESFHRDMGDVPSNKHTIDRINTNGNYEKDNCRWETMQEQSKNRRTCIKIEGFKTAKDYCAANGISYNAYKQKRYKNKLPLPDKPNP